MDLILEGQHVSLVFGDGRLLDSLASFDNTILNLFVSLLLLDRLELFGVLGELFFFHRLNFLLLFILFLLQASFLLLLEELLLRV